jgi:hypothetical protein
MNGQRSRGRSATRSERWAGYLGGILAETAFAVALMLVGLLIAAVLRASG